MLDDGAKRRIAEIVRHMVETGETTSLPSAWVTSEYRYGRPALFMRDDKREDLAATSTRYIPSRWMFMRSKDDDCSQWWVERATTDDVRDEIRDVVLATMADMEYAYLSGEDCYAKAGQLAYLPGSSPVPRMSTSMSESIREWAAEYDCAVSRMFYTFTTKIEPGRHYLTYESVFIEPLPANYLTIRDDGTISYLPRGKYEHAENPWGRRSAGRQDARPSRLIRSMLKPEALAMLTDKDWEVFASRIKGAAAREQMGIELVSGEDIRHWYHGDNYDYSTHTGDLDNSCMRYSRCQRYFDVYVDNPNQCNLLIAKNPENDRLIGRTLVWTTTSGDRVHDRIYGNEATRSALRDWCLDNDIRQAATGDEIALENPWHRHYPYFDTFAYINADGHLLTRYTGSSRDMINPGNTDGGMDLRAGPPVCRTCGVSMGWNGTSRECHTCRDRRIAREREEWLERSIFAAGAPATMNYDQYVRIPRHGYEFTSGRDNGQYYDAIVVGGRYVYRYYPDRGSRSDNLFELIEDRAAPVGEEVAV